MRHTTNFTTKLISLPTLAVSIFLGTITNTTTNAQTYQSHTSKAEVTEVRHGYETVDGLQIFYREAGDPSKPTIVLLHGFPASSHQYRNLIRDLSDAYHLVAPDYPGFGESSFPPANEYEYTFDNLAKTMDNFLQQRGLKEYSLFIQDYGAPIGFRIATAHPERVQTLLVQNGNAYEEGIAEAGWAPIMKYWKDKSPENEKTIIENVFTLEGMKWQYTHGTRNPENIAPETWNLDYMKISRPGQHEVQLRLFYDYQNNIKHYPEWQAYLRENQPPVLIVWGEHDAFFPVPGAEGYRRDVKDVDFNILNTGHFALEEECPFIAKKVREFLGKRIK
ncbi:alpha/beta fold hydrolase [Rhodopirellula sallentina]|uniref:Alpha/beta hydrolase fold protein n=1 Tax=Rhodopirellula sallentina SM41 TaxID=1263870 RepID=M5U513_9BACT|nr:alpha/beta hydrolase [Rhodopirellula sallentina]EMI56354.1 alpha/beta hydrolase fold protein [Rhodopirellula sallentina SM41]